jgi:hypothetical protein
LLIETHQKWDGGIVVWRGEIFQPFSEARAWWLRIQIWKEVPLEERFIVERESFGMGLKKKIKGIIDHHISHQIDFDVEFPHLFREDETGEVVAVGILLPVEKIAFGLDAEGIAQDGGAAMGCRTQPDNMRAHLNEAIIPIMGLMIEGNVKRHEESVVYGS